MDLTKFSILRDMFSNAIGFFLVTREGTVVQTNMNSDELNAPNVGNQIVSIVKDFRTLMDECLYKKEHFLKTFFETESFIVFFIRLDMNTFLVFFIDKKKTENPSSFVKSAMEKIDEIIGKLNL